MSRAVQQDRVAGPPAVPSPQSPGPSYLSPSSIKAYLTCSLRYYFEKVLRLSRPTSPSLHVGKAVHEAVRRYHLSVWRGEGLGAKELIGAYRSAFDSLEAEEPVEFNGPDHRAECLETGERVVGAYLDSEASVLKEMPTGVEVRLEGAVPQVPVPLYGFIDLVRPGNIPVDFKTVASTPSDLELESFLHEIQLVHYTVLLEEATGEAVTGVELIWLVKTKKPKVIPHRMPPPTKEQKERFFALAQIVCEGVRNRRFHPQPGMHCGWCPFRPECSQWSGGGR